MNLILLMCSESLSDIRCSESLWEMGFVSQLSLLLLPLFPSSEFSLSLEGHRTVSPETAAAFCERCGGSA
jgi:hypothetical protein